MEYIYFSCPQCNKKSKTLIKNFHKKVKCSCGKFFYIGAAVDIAFKEERVLKRTLPNENLIVDEIEFKEKVEYYGEIPPSRWENEIYKKGNSCDNKYKYYDAQSEEQNDIKYPNLKSKEQKSIMWNILFLDFMIIIIGMFFYNSVFVSTSELKSVGIYNTYVFIIFFIWIFLPTLIVYMAEQKGTGNYYVWFFVTLLITPIFQIVSLIVLLCLRPPSNN